MNRDLSTLPVRGTADPDAKALDPALLLDEQVVVEQPCVRGVGQSARHVGNATAQAGLLEL
jgi:hypothetical protein